MAGTEHNGWEYAFPELFHGAIWAVTPKENTNNKDYELLKSIIEELGATPVITTPEEHDRDENQRSNKDHQIQGDHLHFYAVAAAFSSQSPSLPFLSASAITSWKDMPAPSMFFLTSDGLKPNVRRNSWEKYPRSL